MATLSHEAFRRCVENFGDCDEYFTEMINASSLLTMGPFEKYYLLNEVAPQKMVWQLTSNNGEKLALAATLLAQKGGIGIDINMACCAPQIYKTGAGISWMLKDLKITQNALSLVKKSLQDYENKTGKHLRLSVKCRLGDENFTENSFFNFTDMLVQEGVELITLHPRTLKEKYRLEPKYEFLKKLCEHYKNLKVPVEIYANGNIKDTNSAKKVLNLCPNVSGLMISRAAAQKPWIFNQIKYELNHSSNFQTSSPQNSNSQTSNLENQIEISKNPQNLENQAESSAKKIHKIDRQECALNFIDYVQKYQPQEFYKTRIQRFFELYCEQFQFGHYFRVQMQNYHSVEESRQKVQDYFFKQPNERFLYY